MTNQFSSVARRHIRKIWLCAIGLALAVISYSLASNEQLVPEAKVHVGTPGAPSFALHSLPAHEKPDATTNGDQSPGKASQMPAAPAIEGILRLTNSANPYPMLVALHARGGPGDFAMVQRFMNECAMASQLAHRAKENGLLQGNSSLIAGLLSEGRYLEHKVNVSSDIHAQRVQASQQIGLRCGQSGQGMPFFDPHPSDQNGKNLSLLHQVGGNEKQLLAAYAQQGAAIRYYGMQMEIVKQHMSEFSTFKNENQIDGLLYLAEFASQADPAAPGNSLRGLAVCVSVGQCGKRPEDLDLSFYDLPQGSPQHAKGGIKSEPQHLAVQ